jgi:hypothetical protein
MSRGVRSSTTKKLFASLSILAAVGVFVSFGVFSLFSQTQSNSSSLTSATFGLTQLPAAGGLLDTLTGLLPGDIVKRCVQLTNSGSGAFTLVAKPSLSGATNMTAQPTMTIARVTGVDTSGTTAALKSCTAASGQTVSAVDTVVSGVAANLLPSSVDLTNAGNSTTWGAGDTAVYQITTALPQSLTAVASNLNVQLTPAVDFVATQVAGSAK